MVQQGTQWYFIANKDAICTKKGEIERENDIVQTKKDEERQTAM